QRSDDLGIERTAEWAVLVGDDGTARCVRRFGERSGKPPHGLAAGRPYGYARGERGTRRIREDRVDDFWQQRRVVVDRTGSVDGIGDAAEFRQRYRDALLHLRVERGERSSCVGQRVRRDGGSTTASGQHHELIADGFVARSDREQLDRLDEFIVAIDLDDAAAAQEGRENFGVAG